MYPAAYDGIHLGYIRIHAGYTKDTAEYNLRGNPPTFKRKPPPTPAGAEVRANVRAAAHGHQLGVPRLQVRCWGPGRERCVLSPLWRAYSYSMGGGGGFGRACVCCIASTNLFCAALAWLACERAWSVCVLVIVCVVAWRVALCISQYLGAEYFSKGGGARDRRVNNAPRPALW